MYRFRPLLSCGVVICLLGVVGCGSSSSSTNSSGSGSAGGSSSSASKDPIKLAILEPTSGPLSAVANQIVDAGKWGVSYVNSHGGVNGAPLQLQVFNTQLDPATAASDYEQAATQDHDLAVLGPLISPEANASVPVAKRTSTPMLLPGAADISFTHPIQQYVFRVGSNESQDDAAIAAEVKHLGCKKPALLYDNGALGLSTKTDIANDMKFTTSVQTSETATDLTPALQQIRAAGATCIVEASDALGAVGSMIATMANTGYKVPVLGDSGVTLASFVATAGAAPLKAVPVYGTNVFNPDTPYFKKLFAGYVSKYGAVPPVEEIASTWDSVQLLAKALKADGGKGGSTLASTLEKTSGSGIPSLIGYGGATPAFSATSHDWVPASADKMFRVTAGPGKTTVLTPTGTGG
jgi:ABC-type branched-subunit amino acid transport system substrate-binding protein